MVVPLDISNALLVPALLFVTVVAMTPNSIIVPGLPLVATGLGVTRPVVGMLITAYTISSGISALFVGMAADSAGRKRVLIPALLLYAGGGVLPLFTRDFGMILAGRAVQGVGGAGLMSSVYGLIGDAYTCPQDRNRVLGTVTGTIAISEVAVPLVGGALAQLGWKAPFAVYALAIPAAVLCVAVLPRPCLSRRGTAEYARGLAPVLGSRAMLAALVAKFAATGAYFVLLTSAPFMVALRLRGSSFLAGLLMIPMGITWAASALSLRRLTERFSSRMLTMVGFALLTIAACGMALAWSEGSMALMFAFWGAGSGLVNPSLLSIIIECAGESYRGAASSLHGCVALVGGSLGPVAAGFLATPSGDPAPAFYLAAAVMVGAAALFAYLTSSAPRRGGATMEE
ncbi:MAG: MFS transporter [Firmicutes bacterium]|nr:MFS transporter [Bacillota bacterium]